MSSLAVVEALAVDELARLLASTYRVPADDAGRPVPIEVGRDILFLFEELTAPLQPLPGATRWISLSGHELLPGLPSHWCVHQVAADRLIPVEALTRPMATLLRAARSEDPARIAEAFSGAVLYCLAGSSPGFLARPDGAIAVFSSLVAMANGCGDVPWFSTTGADLLGLLPDGCHFLLDPSTPHETVLRGHGRGNVGDMGI